MRRDDPKKSPAALPTIPLRPKLKKGSTSSITFRFKRRLPIGFDLASRRVVRLLESAEESGDIAAGEPEPGEIRVNGF
jgi:hypothetical protein